MDSLANFWGNIDKRSEDECWPWKISLNMKNGYGQCSLVGLRHLIGSGDRRVGLAHRVAYILSKGEIPIAYEIDHLCKNRRCCNPAHLEAVTKHENCLRALFFSAENPRNGLEKRSACHRGHKYSDNPKRNADNSRRCGECERTGSEKYRQKKRQYIFESPTSARL